MTLKEIINNYNKILILSGAGVSTASGLKDFRGKNGLYADKTMKVDPITLLSRDHYLEDPQSTIDYIVDNFIVNKDIKPNLGHQFAYDLYKHNKLIGVVTQNIDGLYEQTQLPSEYIVNIHGNGAYFICTKCHKHFDISQLNDKNRSLCCDAIVDTEVILYGDNFERTAYNRYMRMIQEADLVIVMGTTLHISAHMYNVMNVPHRILINNEKLEYNNEMFQNIYIGDINTILKEEYY